MMEGIPQPPPSAGAPPAASAPVGMMSADGLWQWNGRAWVPSVAGVVPARGRATSVGVCLAIWCVAAGLAIAALVIRVALVNQVLSGDVGNLTIDTLRASDTFVRVTVIAELLIYAVTAILLLVWLHRAVSNSYELGEVGLRFTPGWAVGWWFIPFANLVMPALVVAETWKASDPAHVRGTPDVRRTSSAAVVVLWWLAFLLGRVVVGVVAAAADTGQLDGLRSQALISAAGLVIDLIAAGLLIFIVRRITRRQEEKAMRTSGGRSAVPAPPPVP